jgi:hypothetical protein
MTEPKSSKRVKAMLNKSLSPNGLVQRNLKPDPEPIKLVDALLDNYQNPKNLIW